MTYHRIALVTGVKRRVSLVEQELLTLPKHLSSHWVLMRFIFINLLFSVWCLWAIVCPFVFFFRHCIVCPSSIYTYWLIIFKPCFWKSNVWGILMRLKGMSRERIKWCKYFTRMWRLAKWYLKKRLLQLLIKHFRINWTIQFIYQILLYNHWIIKYFCIIIALPNTSV